MLYLKKLLLSLNITVFVSLACAEIVNLEINKYVDITSQFVRIDMTILFKNNGPVQIQNYNYIMDPDIDEAYIEFYSEGKLTYQTQNESSCIVNLEKPILPQTNGVITLQILYLNKIHTVPNKQTQERTVHYSGNLYFYSPYLTLKYSAIYHVDNLEILEISMDPMKRNETDLTYRFQNVKAFSFEEIVMFYFNDIPFFVVTKLDRTIDVSHLGFITVEDNVCLTDEGPKIMAEYRPLPKRVPQLLHTYLPASASNIKLFDDLGNNSKSTIIPADNYITLRFETRYPLRRSWKTNYVLRYNVPIYEYLKRSGNLFQLQMRAIDHVISDAIIREAQIRVLLPQDSEIVSVTHPTDVNRGADQLSRTALSFNRPTIVFTAENIPDDWILKFVITYSGTTFGCFKPALFLCVYIEAVLLSWVLFRRIDMYLNNSP